MTTPSDSPSFRPPAALLAIALIVLTVATYLPILTAETEFLWDDRALIPQSPYINMRVPPSYSGGEQLYMMWCSREPIDYWPVTTTMFWLEWRLYGGGAMDHTATQEDLHTLASGFHITNVLLHAINAMLVWLVLRRLKVPGAWLAAALFAVHPVCVASAGWISERKNTLSMLFLLLACLSYLRFDDQASEKWRARSRPTLWYALAVLAFTAALLSKASVVMLPFVLLGFAWWRRGRIGRRDLLASVPFFLLSLALGLVTVMYQDEGIGAEIVRPEGIASRIAAIGPMIWFYFSKILLPRDLMLTYPRWNIDGASAGAYGPLVLLLGALGAVAYFALKRKRPWAKAVLFGVGYFLVMLLPALGLIQMSWHKFSLVADHFQYLSIIGPIALIVGGAGALLRGRTGPTIGAIGAGAAVLITLGVLTGSHQMIYKDDKAIFQDTMEKNPASWLAYDHMGISAFKAGKYQQALGYIRHALELHEYPEAHANLGAALSRMGRHGEAEAHYRQAIELRESFMKGHYGLAVELQQRGAIDEAIRHYRRAVELEPYYVDARNNLANMLVLKGRVDEALGHYHKILEIDPDNFSAHLSIGALLGRRRQDQQAVQYFLKALELNPGSPRAHTNMANMLARNNQPQAASRHYRQALAIYTQQVQAHPGDPTVRNSLALLLSDLGRLEEAIAHLREALRLRPGYVEARRNLEAMLLRKQAAGKPAPPRHRARGGRSRT
jgi:protein O-mannosyl-transferase